MKLKSIAISNAYSFPYINKKKLEDSHINLYGNNGISINVGANGTGKTNLLKVITYIFKYILIKHYEISTKYEYALSDFIRHKRNLEQYEESLKKKKGHLGKNIDVNYKRIKKNFSEAEYSMNNIISPVFKVVKRISVGNEKYDSVVFLIIALDATDKNYIRNILKNKDDIKYLAQSYSKESSKDINENFFRSLEILCENFDKTKNIFIPVSLINKKILFEYFPKNSEIEKSTKFIAETVIKYLKNYQLIQALVFFHNHSLTSKFRKVPKSKYINDFPYKPHFLSLDIRRGNEASLPEESNYGISSIDFYEYNKAITMAFNEDYKVNISMGSKEYSYIVTLFDFCLSKLKVEFGKDSNYQLNATYLKVSHYLENYLNLKFRLSKSKENDEEIYFIFMKNKREISLNTLSSGERVFIYFIFLFCSNTVSEGAIVLIDEPELHMHPKMQKAFVELLLDIDKSFNIQIILATHSPYFISNENIKSINRFYTYQGCFTKVATSIDTNTLNDKDLMKILETTNSSRIFFADKVILVEGIADEYVFRSYLNIYSKTNNIDVSNIEILQINGKRNYQIWHNFLNKFKIYNYFIGDLDNIEEFLSNSNKQLLAKEKQFLANQVSLKYDDVNGKKNVISLLPRIKNDLEQNNENLKSNINELVKNLEFILYSKVKCNQAMESLKKNKTSVYDKIIGEINALRKQNIFILKLGDIETYTNTKKHDIEKLINFLKKQENIEKLYNECVEFKKIFDIIIK